MKVELENMDQEIKGSFYFLKLSLTHIRLATKELHVRWHGASKNTPISHGSMKTKYRISLSCYNSV